MSGKQGWYLTTAIDYANGAPHMGHALEKIGADAMVRYRRRKGEVTHFVIGMDEHGLSVLQSAEAASITPGQWVDDLADRFTTAWDTLGISRDDFIRTTQPRHHRAVTAMIERMSAAGDLYLGKYEGYYCVRCEAYKTEDELEPLPPEGVVAEDGHEERGRPVLDRRCPLHPNRFVVWLEEENWFFRLSRYRDRLIKLIEERPEFVQPEVRRNEVLRVLEGGLEDISVSRSRLPWGVPWPGSTHTVYVWIDALTNYLSAIGFPDPEYERWWPADVHVIGKDITRFHCIYWPAMLMSADLPLPRTVWAHGFLTFEGRRFSKSAGVWVDLHEAIERHGPDALRYYLLRDVPWNGDGDFSWQRFDAVYTAELADDLGNLANRTLTMVERYRDGVVPAAAETRLDADLAAAVVRYRAAMDASLLHQGAAAALELAAAANAFVGERAPWAQAKDPALASELDATLASLVRTLIALAVMLEPFMPRRMADLARQSGAAGMPLIDELAGLPVAGTRVQRGDVLFPKEPAATRSA